MVVSSAGFSSQRSDCCVQMVGQSQHWHAVGRTYYISLLRIPWVTHGKPMGGEGCRRVVCLLYSLVICLFSVVAMVLDWAQRFHNNFADEIFWRERMQHLFSLCVGVFVCLFLMSRLMVWVHGKEGWPSPCQRIIAEKQLIAKYMCPAFLLSCSQVITLNSCWMNGGRNGVFPVWYQFLLGFLLSGNVLWAIRCWKLTFYTLSNRRGFIVL